MQTITAMFDDLAEAQAAAERIVATGVAPGSVRIHATEGEVDETGEPHAKGFWASIGDLFVPADDHATYAEGVRRGSSVVSVDSDEAHFDTVRAILEEQGSVDVDARAREWLASGWSGAGDTGRFVAPDAISGTTAAGLAVPPGGLDDRPSGVHALGSVAAGEAALKAPARLPAGGPRVKAYPKAQLDQETELVQEGGVVNSGGIGLSG